MIHRSILFLSFLILSIGISHSQVIFEAEDAEYSSGKTDNKHAGFTGDGFVDTENTMNEWIEWTIYSYKEVKDSVSFRYALGKEENRAMQVYINGTLTDTIDFDFTTEFTNYIYKSTLGNIVEGVNTIKLVSITENGAPNLDHLTVKTDIGRYFKITSTIAGSGTVTITPETDSIKYGTRVTLLANNNPGYTFNNWSGNIDNVKNPLSFTVDNNYSITANFINSIPAFPGAEGFAAKTTGGRGGAVYEVTNLNNSGAGSLRDAIQKSGNRTIVFRVSGTIELESSLSVNNGNLTIAGQTAPGDGITLSGFTLKVNADNVIIRYIRSRLGDKKLAQDDAMNGYNNSNIIIDHCSLGWSVDEVTSFYDNRKFTMQYCMVSEGLYNSVHDKGPHSYGGIWGGKGATFHHNLLAHNVSRNPRFCGTRYSNQPELELIDFRNNVIFNWGKNSIYGAEGGSYNLVNNYYKYGPATSSDVRSRIIAPNADDGSNEQSAGVWGVFYVGGNFVDGSETVTESNWAGVHASGVALSTIKSETEFTVDSVTTHSAKVAYEHVLAQAGAVLPFRDEVDSRIIQETLMRKVTFGDTFGAGMGIIDSQESVGGWPELRSTTPPVDADKDGMPDEWELQNNLNPNDAEDRNGDANGDGYTNLENYLNGLVADYTYLIRPINFEAELINNQEVDLNWTDVVENEDAFLLERKEGNSAYEEIANLPANTTNYKDAVTNPAVYSYRLRAVNTKDSSFYTDSVAITIVTDIDKQQANNSIVVYPNPFSSSINIEFDQNTLMVTQIKLIDLIGNKLWVQNNITQNGTAINVENLHEGIYFIIILTPIDTYVKKIIKNN
ncbi:MAG: T9SS type A sorting domain-containing protein [Salinivirgaceae bacterium]|jgi:hypothetical protein|nr:T9SS type A sorting domain-containing protein [Salinivirgaceae bacterium]